MFVRLSILLVPKSQKNFQFFAEMVEQLSSPCVRKTFIENLLAKQEIFWEPSSQVPILFVAL